MLTTAWKRVIDDVIRPVLVTTEELPLEPQEAEIPSCWWKSVGAGANQTWIWRCEVSCLCEEMGWLVEGVW